MVEQQLLAQHGVGRLGQGRPLAGTEFAVIAEEPGNHLVGGMIEFQDEADQIGTGLQQGFGMHEGDCLSRRPLCSDNAIPTRPTRLP